MDTELVIRQQQALYRMSLDNKIHITTTTTAATTTTTIIIIIIVYEYNT